MAKTTIKENLEEEAQQIKVDVEVGDKSATTVMTYKRMAQTVKFTRLGDLSDRELTKNQILAVVKLLQYGANFLK